jgi:7,8-dihydropterin-6-yl-methyl-4-(beta-D-ribofuranosyl)aminobenzene 5'-phosphate synthase
MPLKLTVLSENTAGMGDFLAEWGLSILIQTADSNVLLDTGTSISAIHNAETLSIDFSSIDKIVLSHGHYDHTGGLREVLRRAKKSIDIIAHPDIWQPKYSQRRGEAGKYIGIPFAKNELESLGAHFIYTTEPYDITSDILVTGEVPMLNEYETIDPALVVAAEDGTRQPDPLLDDRAVIIKTGDGLVVVLGCAHRGMINTLNYARQISGVSQIQAVVGGSHLIGASEERLWLTIAALQEMNIQKLGLCHCTDLPSISILAREFPENFLFVKAGSVIELP